MSKDCVIVGNVCTGLAYRWGLSVLLGYFAGGFAFLQVKWAAYWAPMRSLFIVGRVT